MTARRRHYCLICLRPLPRRWWHRLVEPILICGPEDADACTQAARAPSAEARVWIVVADGKGTW